MLQSALNSRIRIRNVDIEQVKLRIAKSSVKIKPRRALILRCRIGLTCKITLDVSGYSGVGGLCGKLTNVFNII